jgi:hypothetical protein
MGILLEDVFVRFGLVGVHGVGQLLPLELAQLEQQKVLADCFLDELQVLGGFWLIDFLDVLEDLLCRRAPVQSFELVLFLAGVVDRL